LLSTHSTIKMPSIVFASSSKNRSQTHSPRK
jgi:hypothetical protein